MGTPAPDFDIVDEGGRAHRLAEFRGRPLVLAFRPPRLERPQPTYQEIVFQGERLAVLSPSDAAVATRYDAGAVPAVFLVDSNGLLKWRHSTADGDPAAPDRDLLLSRRDFVAATLAASLAVAFSAGASAAPFGSAATPVADAPALGVELTVNGRPVHWSIDPRTTLLDALRERAHLTGSKKGCDHGQCGACTVHVDGRRVLSCLTLAASLTGKSVTTIEGLSTGDALHPMQQAFIDFDGFQCGYCTAGQIMSAVALLGEPCGPSDDDVRECMSGNICRCGAYAGIVAAFQRVRGSGERSVR